MARPVDQQIRSLSGLLLYTDSAGYTYYCDSYRIENGTGYRGFLKEHDADRMPSVKRQRVLQFFGVSVKPHAFRV